MNLFSVQPERGLPEEIKKRLAAGVIVSLLLHAFVLSLQFGLPGLGLPELEAPWNKRRAQIPALSIQLAKLPPAPVAALLPAVPEIAAPVPPASQPQAQVAPQGIQLLAPQTETTPAPAQAPAQASHARKSSIGPPPVAPRVRKQAAPDVPRIIAQDVVRDDSFVMPVPDPDEPLKKTEAETETTNDELTQAGIEPEAEQKKAEAAVAAQQKRQQESEQRQRRRDEELAQKNAAELAAQQQQLARQLEQESRLQAEDALRQQTAALALQKQLEAQEQQRRVQQENSRNEALRLAEQQRRDENRRLQEQQKEQLQREQLRQEQLQKQRQLALEQAQEERRQAEVRAAETARRQAAELARQKLEQQAAQARAEELAARQKAEELAARQRAEQMAAGQRAQELAQAQAALANAAASSQGSDAATGDKPSAFVLPKSLLSSDLASRAQQQARGMDLLRGAPPRTESEPAPRRRSILGSLDKDVPLRMYVDSWKQKIERNGNLNYSQLAKDRARGDPLVTVAIRSDGSVEDITINRSSGRADLDEAVRRIVRLNARYAAFPPNIAAQYDVIEIRRIWNFDEVLRIVEELR